MVRRMSNAQQVRVAVVQAAPVLFNRDAGSYWMLTAIAMSVGGFAMLVARLPRDHEDDDDGARL